MNTDNFYDQLARDDFVTGQAQFQDEMKQIKQGLDRDLAGGFVQSSSGPRLQESSGLVNAQGLREPSLYNNHIAATQAQMQQQQPTAEHMAPNFGRRDRVQLADEDFNLGAAGDFSARNARDSADLTIDMLGGGRAGGLAPRVIPSEEAPKNGNSMMPDGSSSNIPRNQSSLLNNVMKGPSVHNIMGADQVPHSGSGVEDGFSIEQFRQNQAQLQEIMMGLQSQTPMPPQPASFANNQASAAGHFRGHKDSTFSAYQAQSEDTDDRFKQLSSAATAKQSGSNPSTKHLTTVGGGPGHMPSEVSQFSYKGEEVELPGMSQPVHNGQLQQQAKPQTTSSNYRQVFKPASAFQSAAHNMINDSKENFSMQANLNQNTTNNQQVQGFNNQPSQQQFNHQMAPNPNPSHGLNSLNPNPLSNHHVSQVELLSQLQMSTASHQNQKPQHFQTMDRRAQPPKHFQQQAPTAHNASQPSLAGEFTLQPRQPSLAAQPSNHSDSQQQLSQQMPAHNQVLERHQQIMAHFDDIPITQIRKMPGYQTGKDMVDDAGTPDPMASAFNQPEEAGPTQNLEDEDAQARPLEERIHHGKWSIRLAAYKEINNLFYSDYAAYEATKDTPEYGPQGHIDIMQRSFDQYGPLLEKMISDTNAVAAYEGLQVMHTYVKMALDIKSVTFAAHNFLLEKAPNLKPNAREISIKIVLVMLERDQAAFLYPELVKRLKSTSSQKVASFANTVVNEAFKNQSSADEPNLKNVFRMIQDNLSQKNKELRDLAMQILQHIFVRCGDDRDSFIGNCKNLRPVQQKEIKEVLSKLEKSTKPQHQAKLFDSSGEDEAGVKAADRDTSADRHGKHAGHSGAAHEAPSRDSNSASALAGGQEADLMTLVPENFTEIPYIAQINVKKRAMESFNSELQKLLAQGGGRPGCVQVKNRDYTMIYNILGHMLEDKNMLVFVEAIKTVELLSCIMGPLNLMKQVKVKMWIGLLAGKYSETKTPVIAAVDRAMLAIVNHAYNQVSFSTECVNVIASTHKNPRVKQFVIEHAMVPFVESIATQKDLIGNIFRAIKDKVVQMVLKDTSATCRDAAVTFLVTLKQLLPADNVLVEQAISQLPKYRVSEIQRRVAEASGVDELSKQASSVPVDERPIKQASRQSARGDSGPAAETQEQQAAKPAKGNGTGSQLQRAWSGKRQNAGQSEPQAPQQQEQYEPSLSDKLLEGRFISQETKGPLMEILYDFNLMHQNRFDTLAEPQFLEHKWDESLRQMGEMGLRECKASIILAVFTVVTTPKIQLFDNAHFLKSMLNLAKRLYVLERSIQRQDDGRSSELEQYLKVALLQNVWIANNQGETCQMLQVAMVATGNAFEFTEHLREVVEQPIIIQCPAALQVIEAVYVWLGIRLNDFLAAGMEISDLEMLRGFGIRFLDGAGFSEPQRQALISIMIKFKELVQHKRHEMEGPAQSERSHHLEESQGVDKELPSVSQLSRQQTPQLTGDSPTRNGEDAGLQSSQVTQPQTAAFPSESLMQDSLAESQTPGRESTHESSVETVITLIDTEFEKGLLMFKEMAQKQTLEFEIKERIFKKLLSIVSDGYKATSPQQQYKQAYALKALMWMKEETLGVEECFRLTQKVMGIYAKSEVDELDSTVELYLLNFWAKDLSIRDLADRIGLCVLNSANDSLEHTAYQTGYSVSQTAQSCSENQLGVFNSLLKWFSDKRLFAEEPGEAGDSEEWMVSDLRKIVLYITLSVLDRKVAKCQTSRAFLKRCVGKFGIERVKEFMEIQLMHHNELSLQLLDWLDTSAESRVMQVQPEPKKNNYSVVDSIQVAALKTVEGDESEQTPYSKVKLPSLPPVNMDEVIGNSRAGVNQSLYSAGGDSSSHKNGGGSNTGAGGGGNSSRQTPRGLSAASQSYKERRDLYKMKSSGKVRESMQQEESVAGAQAKAAGPSTSIGSYTDIISRIEQNLGGGQPGATSIAVRDSREIAEASGESDEKDYSKPRLDPEASHHLQSSHEGGLDAKSQAEASQAEAEQPFRRTNTSAYYRSIERKRKRYTPSAEELADDQDIKGDSSSSDDESTVTNQRSTEEQRRPDAHSAKGQVPQVESAARVSIIESQLELSAMKGKHINEKIQMLELEKERIEMASEQLKHQKDEESAEWRQKVQQMELERDKVMSNLKSVNNQYQSQVNENEMLKGELQKMQRQHSEMMDRFEQIEKKLNEDRDKEQRRLAQSPNKGHMPSMIATRESTAKKDMVVSVQKIQRIEDTFGQAMALQDGYNTKGSETEIQQMISRIQKLLLGVERNVDGELAQPLIIHYSKLKQQDQRMQMLNAMSMALDENVDVLTALSAQVYKALLNYLLWAFAHEKQILEQTNLSTANGINNSQADQNEVTMLSQQLVSKLLNSKRFTTSLVCLFQLLREGMPNDIAAELSIEERQYLRVIMRCIQRITRALHSEQHDLVRAFDVLLEMQKMFQKHPPELLREDLPCLADFDFIYRGMKDVSDKLTELQPEKVESFLSYATGVEGEAQNAFIKYLSSVIQGSQ